MDHSECKVPEEVTHESGAEVGDGSRKKDQPKLSSQKDITGHFTAVASPGGPSVLPLASSSVRVMSRFKLEMLPFFHITSLPRQKPPMREPVSVALPQC